MIQEMISEKLKEIEQRENVRILHCVESGSRAWGFASPDSDYDVRFVYVRPLEYYLKLEKTRDVIEWQLDDTLDINGWDLQKTLRLLHKSNPTVFEWNNSPIVYKTTEDWLRVSEVISACFNVKTGVYHYYATAKTNFAAYLQGDVLKLKKYFYALRPILACRWILEKGTPPPMLFSELAESQLEEPLRPVTEELVRIKTTSLETAYGERIDILNEYIERSLTEIKDLLHNMDKSECCSWERLNKVFRELVK